MVYAYYVLVFVIFGATLAMTVQEGLWNNLMTLANLMLASVIAFGFYQPLTILLDEWSGGQYTYVLDHLVFWFLFGLAVTVLKTLGVSLSDTKLKFLHPLNKFAGPAVGVLCGLVLASVVAMSLHMTPFGKDFLGGALVHEGGAADSPSLVGSPDLSFLAAVSLFANPDGLGGAG
ncbi:MAG: CvpA family protein, partial [Planctomycetales bacterium]|nr:CvpA family protein [Planctomycetales bacterium]